MASADMRNECRLSPAKLRDRFAIRPRWRSLERRGWILLHPRSRSWEAYLSDQRLVKGKLSILGLASEVELVSSKKLCALCAIKSPVVNNIVRNRFNDGPINNTPLEATESCH